MRYIIFFVFNLLVIVFCSGTMGQSLHSKAEVRAMFPDNTKNLWINFLSGSLEGGHTIDMIIGTDGNTCKGLYTMRSSKVTFYFDGQEHENKQLRLVESDENGRATGFLIGIFNGETFNGTWMNKSKKIVLPFALNLVNAFSDFKQKSCQDMLWEAHYAGKLNNDNIFLSIAKNRDIITCQMNEQGVFVQNEITINPNSRIYNLTPNFPNTILDNKVIVLDTQDFTRISIATLDESHYELNASLTLERKLIYQCYEYADHVCRMGLTRPYLGHKAFDPWIEKKCQQWLERSRQELVNGKSTSLGLSDRWSQTADSWVELDLFDDDIISGTIYFQSSWHTGVEKIPFIFSLKTGKELHIKDIFDPKFDYQSFFNEVINTYKSSSKLASNKPLWYENFPFKFYTLTREGILLRTDFSMIYGEEKLIIPYVDLSQYIRYRPIRKDIMTRL